MAYCDSLKICCTRKRTVVSNPSSPQESRLKRGLSLCPLLGYLLLFIGSYKYHEENLDQDHSVKPDLRSFHSKVIAFPYPLNYLLT